MPLRQCYLDDVKTFQLALPGYQIHIVSKESFNAIVYQGPEAEKKIYLYHHDNHYDVITTMPGFLNRSYFCQKCQKGYDHKEKHICNEPCYLCHKCHEDQSEYWQYCSTCNRHFKNKTCLQLHAKVSSQGNLSDVLSLPSVFHHSEQKQIETTARVWSQILRHLQNVYV